jgi:predicted naringenin-chalcone synthase
LAALPYSSIRHWAIHPGGRSILDKVESRLGLTQEQLVPAREVLRNYGNMSSATVLFVIKHILEQDPEPGDERICSMAFGPGLTVETAVFTKLRQARTARPARTSPAEQAPERLPAEAPVA